MTDRFHASCMCGAIQIEAGAPDGIFHCHCESCRRSTGQPLVTFASYLADRVTFTGAERKVYNSSPGVSRTFCPDCGTPLAWEGHSKAVGENLVELYIGLFRERDVMIPTHHIYYEERVPWFDVADGLPRYRGVSRSGLAIAHGPARTGLPG